MNALLQHIGPLTRAGTLLATTLLFLVVWGVAGLGKVQSGIPPWFADKFGQTFLASFPGLTASFWLLTAGEVLAFLLCLGSLIRLEFLNRKGTPLLQLMLVWSLFLFVQLSLGQWLTSEYNGSFMLFTYFCGTLVALRHVAQPTIES